jgi:hypothetical protein
LIRRADDDPKTTVGLDDESTAKKTLRLIDAGGERRRRGLNFDIPSA